ncbi:hypothetical protein [Streptosporangium canum]
MSGFRVPIGRPRTRPGMVAADKVYSSHADRTYLRGRGIQAVIPEKADQAAIHPPAAYLTSQGTTT